jgi:hypothetical protein
MLPTPRRSAKRSAGQACGSWRPRRPKQQNCLMLHRTRHLFIRQQTAVINSIRAHLGRSGTGILCHVLMSPRLHVPSQLPQLHHPGERKPRGCHRRILCGRERNALQLSPDQRRPIHHVRSPGSQYTFLLSIFGRSNHRVVHRRIRPGTRTSSAVTDAYLRLPAIASHRSWGPS